MKVPMVYWNIIKVDLENNSFIENWCGIAFLVTGFIVLKGDRRMTLSL